MGTIIEVKTTKGKTAYDAEVRHRGHPTLYRRFYRRIDARMWIQDTESNLRSGRHIPQTEALRHTLADAVDRFVIEVLPRKPRYYADQKREVPLGLPSES
jgi:hypothetical protein